MGLIGDDTIPEEERYDPKKYKWKIGRWEIDKYATKFIITVISLIAIFSFICMR